MGNRILDTAAVVVAITVVASTTMAGYALLRPGSPVVGVTELGKVGPRDVEDAESYALRGNRIGPAGAKHVLVEFAEFECPYCKTFSEGTLRQLRGRYPADLAVVFRHAPIPSHRLAAPASKAAICAGAVGRFEAMHDLLFEKQDSIGLKSFDDFAVDAGVRDLFAFRECTSSRVTDSVLAREVEDARQAGVSGTPSILINGVLYTGIMSVDEVAAALDLKR